MHQVLDDTFKFLHIFQTATQVFPSHRPFFIFGWRDVEVGI